MTLEPDLSLRHLLAELARIDMRLQVAVRRWQQAGQDATDGFRGLYVSDLEVDSLLARPVGGNWGQSAPLEAAEAARFVAAESAAGTRAQALVAAAEQRGEPIRLQLLAQAFDLDAFDLDALLICLAPELDLRYERVYGYLQDDVTRRRPSVDLVLALLAPTAESRLQLRERFAPSAPLIRHDLLYLFQDPSRPEPPLLGKHLKVDERVIDYLLGVDRLDALAGAVYRPRGA